MYALRTSSTDDLSAPLLDPKTQDKMFIILEEIVTLNQCYRLFKQLRTCPRGRGGAYTYNIPSTDDGIFITVPILQLHKLTSQETRPTVTRSITTPRT